MDYIIIENVVDASAAHRIRVIVDENNTIFLKFDHYPSQEEVNTTVEYCLNYYDNF